jgi:hypothetical protein
VEEKVDDMSTEFTQKMKKLRANIDDRCKFIGFVKKE